MKSIRLGRIGGLELKAHPSALAGFGLLWGGLSLFGRRRLRLSWQTAVLGGLAATGLHLAACLWHQAGHAAAAAASGFPMRGIRLWGVLSSSLYPRDEPVLPAEVHLQRAFGGPLASGLLSLAAGLLALLLRPLGDVYAGLGLFFFADNLLVFTLGAFVPLGFTDGSTILHWWPQRGRPNLVIE